MPSPSCRRTVVLFKAGNCRVAVGSTLAWLKISLGPTPDLPLPHKTRLRARYLN